MYIPRTDIALPFKLFPFCLAAGVASLIHLLPSRIQAEARVKILFHNSSSNYSCSPASSRLCHNSLHNFNAD
jgi:hypothetical protein